MSGIAIYMEGGGDSASTKAELRNGMNAFLGVLKDLARKKSMRWKLVPVGGREQAFQRFRTQPAEPEYPIRVLLVDAEAPITASDKRKHLKARDGWDLTTADEHLVHLMCQTMEAWIVADPAALAGFYGQHFKTNALPKAQNLETVSKTNLANAIDQATRDCKTKGQYHKIRHASALLKLINPEAVKARCPHCRTLFADMKTAIDGA